MQGNWKKYVSAFYKCATENYAQYLNTQKTQACKITYKNAFLNPNRKMNYKKQ